MSAPDKPVERDPIPPIPEDLIQAGAEGKLAVLLGAGAGYDEDRGEWVVPLWERFLEDLVARAKKDASDEETHTKIGEIEKQKDLLRRATLLRAAMGEAWLRDAIVNRIEAAGDCPTPIHRAVAELPGARILTTNYDRLIEMAISKMTGTDVPVATPADIEALAKLDPRTLVKIHGTVQRPETIVLTIKDYFKMSHAIEKAWQERIKQIIQQPGARTLLVGYGYGDSDIQRVYDSLREAYQGHLVRPYWLEPQSFTTESLAEEYGLQCLAGYRSHDQLVPWLRKLKEEIEGRKSRPLMALEAYAGVVYRGFETRDDEAQKIFKAHRFDQARQTYRAMLDEAEQLLSQDQENQELRSWLARLRLKIAQCLLCLQDKQEARRFLTQITIDDLREHPKDLARVSEGLAQVGLLEQARMILPDDVPEDAREDIRGARQLLDIIEGRYFENPVEEPWLLAKYCWLLNQHGRLEQAADTALRVLDMAKDRPLSTAEAMAALVHCLERSVREHPRPPHPVPRDKRRAVIDAIESAFKRLDALPVPPAVIDHVRLERVRFYQLTADDEGINWAQRIAKERGEPVPNIDPAAQRAFELRRQGRFDEALSALPQQGHPWLDTIRRARLFVLGHRLKEALELLLPLQEAWPGEWDVEFNLAEVLARLERHGEALPHAEQAFDALPGRGARLLLARCLIATADPRQEGNAAAKRAWELLEPFSSSAWPEAVLARASAASQLESGSASGIWREFLSLEGQQDNCEARVRLVQCLFREGKRAEAAAEAWATFEAHRQRLDVDALGLFSEVLLLERDSLTAESKLRLKSIAREARQRTAGDPRGEVVYVRIYHALGAPADMAPVSYPYLMEAGVARQVEIDEAARIIRESRNRADAAWMLYRLGRLTVEDYFELTGMAPPLLLEEMLRAPGPSDHFLSTPVVLEVQQAVELEGNALLCGELELFILAELGLLDRLRRALGREGQVVLFRDVIRAVEMRVLDLKLAAQEERLRQSRDLLKLVRHKSATREQQDASDEKLAGRTGMVLVCDTPPENATRWISTRSLIERLRTEGLVEKDSAAAMLAALPVEEMTGELPDGPLILSYPALVRLHHLGAVQEMIEQGWPFYVDSEDMVFLGREIEELELKSRASHRAAEVRDWVIEGKARGWIRQLERPEEETGLPPAREPKAPPLIRDTIGRALGWYQATEELAGGLLLTADFLVEALFSGSAPVELFVSLAWTEESYRDMAGRIRALAPRRLGLPGLVRLLMPEGAGDSMLEIMLKLARLGFHDALGAGELLRMARLYGDLDGRKPAQVLDRMEWTARQKDHPVALVARYALSRLYGETIWRSWTEEEWSKDERVNVTQVLLDRVEALDRKTGPGGLDRTLLFVAVQAVDHLEASFVPEDSKMMTLSRDSRAGRLWAYLHRWAAGNIARQEAMTRAVLDTFCFVDRRAGTGEPNEAAVHALMLSVTGIDELQDKNGIPVREARRQSEERWSPLVQAVSILSGNWTLRPLTMLGLLLDVEGVGGRDLSPEEVCQLGAEHVRDRRLGLEGRVFDLWVPVLVSDWRGQWVQLPVPAEAVLLRALSKETSDLISALRIVVGPHDGRLYQILQQLESRPQDQELRRELARAAVLSPARLVRQDPLWITAWSRAQVFAGGFPGSLQELRLMLSEPGPLPEDEDLRDVLHARLTEGGAWHGRPDSWQLAVLSSGVPGDLAAMPVRTLLEGEGYEQEVQGALSRLQEPDNLPAARLVADIVFLRAAAAHRPLVRWDKGEIDLQEVLPERLVHVLQAVSSSLPGAEGGTDAVPSATPSGELSMQEPAGEQPPAGKIRGAGQLTLATMEPFLLRHCARVVMNLARGAGPHPPLRDLLWLTWRLYQWLVAQLVTLAPDLRQAALERFRGLAPPPAPHEDCSPDLLDPGRFAPDRFHHRLAAVLYALFLSEAVSFSLRREEGSIITRPKSVSSGRLERLLVDLAGRSPTEEERRLARETGHPVSLLGWDGPLSVPELALSALLALNSASFFDLAEPTRIRWLSDLTAERGERRPLHRRTISGLLSLVAEWGQRLSPAERESFGDTLPVLAQDPEMGDLVLLAITGLLRAGDTQVKPRIDALLCQRLDKEDLWKPLGHYLAALTFTSPERVEPVFRQYVQLVAQAGGDPSPLAGALGNAIFSGDRRAVVEVSALLRRIASELPFKDNEQVARLIGLLGLDKE